MAWREGVLLMKYAYAVPEFASFLLLMIVGVYGYRTTKLRLFLLLIIASIVPLAFGLIILIAEMR